jgi:type I restriction enzyme S subunit
MSWEKVEFNDVLEKIVGGGTPSKTIPDYWNGDIPWCSVKDMVGDKYQLYSTEDTITNSGLENSSANLILAGTVITSTRMGLGRAFINKVDMAINQDLKALIPNEKIDNTFLLWTIVNKKEEIEGLGIGSTVKGIRLEVLRGLKFNLPPHPTQNRVHFIGL